MSARSYAFYSVRAQLFFFLLLYTTLFLPYITTPLINGWYLEYNHGSLRYPSHISHIPALELRTIILLRKAGIRPIGERHDNT